MLSFMRLHAGLIGWLTSIVTSSIASATAEATARFTSPTLPAAAAACLDTLTSLASQHVGLTGADSATAVGSYGQAVAALAGAAATSARSVGTGLRTSILGDVGAARLEAVAASGEMAREVSCSAVQVMRHVLDAVAVRKAAGLWSQVRIVRGHLEKL